MTDDEMAKQCVEAFPPFKDYADSSPAAGSGAREQFKVWIAKNGYNPNKQANVRWKDIAGWCEYFIREVWEPQYADHCTAQLREQHAEQVRAMFAFSSELATRLEEVEHEKDVAEAELTAERTKLDQAYTYLEGMLRLVAPAEPLPDLMGVCTQIDNFIVGERTRRGAAEADASDLLWNLAGCDAIAMGWSKPEVSVPHRPALDSVCRLAKRTEAAERDLKELRLMFRPMSEAPMNAKEVYGLIEYKGQYEVKVIHYAEDLSGSEQPPFKGWFYRVGDHSYNAVVGAIHGWAALRGKEGE